MKTFAFLLFLLGLAMVFVSILLPRTTGLVVASLGGLLVFAGWSLQLAANKRP